MLDRELFLNHTHSDRAMEENAEEKSGPPSLPSSYTFQREIPTLCRLRLDFGDEEERLVLAESGKTGDSVVINLLEVKRVHG